MKENVGSLGKEELVTSIGWQSLAGSLWSLVRQVQGPFLEERSCRPSGEWELLDARIGEGFQASGLLSSLRRRN